MSASAELSPSESSQSPVEASPLRSLLQLAAPTVAQMASYTLMQFIDTWMLSRLGTEAPTAAGNAGIFAFAIISFGVGVMFVVNTLASQEYGRGRLGHCGKFFWQGVWFAVLYSLLLLPMLPAISRVFSLFDHPSKLLGLETTYLEITLGLAIIKLIATAGGQFLLATNRPNAVLFSALAGVSANAILAYGIILGGFGLPKLGVTGAAWAQNFGATIEMLVLLCFVFNPVSRKTFHSLDWKFRRSEFVTLIKIGFGSGVQIVADVMAWSLFIVLVVARLGEQAMAANQFTFRYMTVSFMPAFGIAQAVTALVGRNIGAKNPDGALHIAKLGYRVTAIYMLACGAMFAIFRYPLMRVFTHDPAVLQMGATLLLFAAAYQLFDARYMVYNGALRGAGDTFLPAMVTGASCWGINVGLAYLIVWRWPHLGVAGPWIACMTYGVALGTFVGWRFKRGQWRKIHLIEDAAIDSNAGDFAVSLPGPKVMTSL